MKKRIPVVFSFFLILMSCNSRVKTIEWVSSSPVSEWHSAQVTTNSKIKELDSTIRVFPENKQQIIEGFGGCFNELGWEAMNSISPDNREIIFKALFDTLTGCKFNICRMPIGANDYAVDWYSHNETKDDFDMDHFSVDRDSLRIVPYIMKARTYNPGLNIWASPWCPPAWMKTNNHYACSPDTVNKLTDAGKGTEMVTQFRMEDKYLAAYALYFSKFILAYENKGIPIYAVHVQNEPNSCQIFPSCIWNPFDLAKFIGEYLGPQLKKDNPETEIWLGTIERPQIERIDTILSNHKAAEYIKGVGFQWAGKDAIPEVHKKYPGYKLMQTETECGNGSNDWKAAEHTFDLMKHYFNNGANAYMYWNMVLNETGKSQWGWKQNSMITIQSGTKEITYNPEYYLIKHFSSFIKAGAYKIETSDKNCLAFKNDDSIVLVIYNSGGKTEKNFLIGNIQFNVVLSEKSFNTFKINN